MKLTIVLVLMLAAVRAWAGPFEGILYVEATIEQVGTVPSQILVRENGDSRVDTKGDAADLDVSMLRRRGKPIVRLLHAQKAWVEVGANAAKADDPGAAPPPARRLEPLAPIEIELKTLGPEMIAGVATQHVQMRERAGNTLTELWLARELEIADGLELVAPQQAAELRESLAKHGLAGWPMKVVTTEAGHTVTVETIKVERKKLSADVFEVPKSYTKAER